MHLPIDFPRLALLALLLISTDLSAQQFLYTQDLAFQTITPTPARAGTFALYPYGASHFVARANEILNPADFAVYDSLGQPTGQHFYFHPAFASTNAQQFYADAGGHAYIAGTYSDTSLLPISQSRIVVAKFLPNGDPDSSWGQQGIWYGDTASNGYGGVFKLQVLASGAVMLIDHPSVAGASSPYYYVRRLTPSGQLDTAFGSQGSAIINPDNRPAQAFYFAENGSTYACVNFGSPASAWMARWFANGQRDTTFNIPGSVRGIFNILPDGRIVSDGYTVGGGWGLRRHWSNGTADAGYIAPTVPNSGYDFARPDGGRLFWDEAYNGTPFPTLIEFMAILPDGTQDPAYMPAGQPMAFNVPASFWPPAADCHSEAVPGFGNLLALGPRRLIYADYLVATLLTGTFPEYEYYVCPRIISLVTDLQTVGQPAPGEVASLSCAPNPVADHFSLLIPTRARAAQVQLYDLAGKALALPTPAITTVEGGLQYAYQDLGGLPSGLYLLRVAAGDQQFTAKLLKE